MKHELVDVRSNPAKYKLTDKVITLTIKRGKYIHLQTIYILFREGSSLLGY